MKKFTYRNYVVTLETFDGENYLYSIEDMGSNVYTLDDVKSAIDEFASDDVADVCVEVNDSRDELTGADMVYYDELVAKLHDTNVYVIE